MNFNIFENDPTWKPSRTDPPWNVMADLREKGACFYFGASTAEGFKAIELTSEEVYDATVAYLKDNPGIEHSFYLLQPFGVQLWDAAAGLKYK